MQCVNKDFLAGAISSTFSLHVSGPAYLYSLYFYASIALVDLSILLIEVSRSHSVEFLWTNDQSDAKTSS
jgi:hypothetical protein